MTRRRINIDFWDAELHADFKDLLRQVDPVRQQLELSLRHTMAVGVNLLALATKDETIDDAVLAAVVDRTRRVPGRRLTAHTASLTYAFGGANFGNHTFVSTTTIGRPTAWKCESCCVYWKPTDRFIEATHLCPGTKDDDEFRIYREVLDQHGREAVFEPGFRVRKRKKATPGS